MMTWEELDQIEAGLKKWQRPDDWGLKLVAELRAALLKINDLKAQSDNLEFYANELSDFRSDSLPLIDSLKKMLEECYKYAGCAYSAMDEYDACKDDKTSGIFYPAGCPVCRSRDLLQQRRQSMCACFEAPSLCPEHPEKHKCAHCGSESENMTCSVCIEKREHQKGKCWCGGVHTIN